MISSVTLFVQVPFVSTLLQFTGYYIIAGSNTTTIIHQAMLLKGLPLNFLFSELVLVPGCRQSLGFTLLVTRNQLCRLLPQAEVFLLLLDVVTPMITGTLVDFEDVPFHTLRQLAEFDRRKSLVAERMMLELLGSTFRNIFGTPGTARTLASHTIFECIHIDEFDALSPEFLSLRFNYDKLTHTLPGDQ